MSEETTQQTLSGLDAEQAAATQAQSPAASTTPEKPSWLWDDKYYDANVGVKYEELAKDTKEIFDFKSKLEADAAARKAEMPEKADGYGYAPEDYKLPEGYKLDTNSPMWKLLQETAYEKGLTKKEYNAMASKFIEASNEHQANAVKAYNAQKNELMKQLGDDAPAQIAQLSSFFTSSFGEQVAQQLNETLWTPDIVRSWQKVQKAITSQGAGSFSALGRDGANGGDDADFAKLSFVDKWHRKNNQDRRAS